MNNFERLEGLRLMVVTCPEGLMVLACPDFLSLEIYDLSKGKELAKMVKREKPETNLLILEPVGGGPKFLIDGTLSEE